MQTSWQLSHISKHLSFFSHHQRANTQETKLQLVFQQVIWKGYELEGEQDTNETERNWLYHKEENILENRAMKNKQTKKCKSETKKG